MADVKQESMLDVAYSIMVNHQKAMDFYKLYDEVCEKKGFDEDKKNEQRSLFYTNITLDGRFITIGENQWDLRNRHKFEEVHIDMNDIYNEEEHEEEYDEIYEDDSDDSSEEDKY